MSKKVYDPAQPNLVILEPDEKDQEIQLLRYQLSQTNTDFQEFMNFFFENNPDLA